MDIDTVHYRQMYLKCCDKLTSKMKKAVFSDVVVGDLFPPAIGDFLFYAFGGSNDGLSFDNLVRGLVSISKRRDDWRNVRTHLMFRVVSNPPSEYVHKSKLFNLFKLTESPEKFDKIRRYFDNSLAIDFAMFNAWVNLNCESYTLTSWFFTEVVPGFNLPPVVKNDAFAVPTLYGTIAKITHLEENEIELLEKQFATLCGANRVSMDYQIFHSLVCPPIADEITRGFFNSFDSNRDGIIDFKEYAYGVSACCRGPKAERRKFLFRMFDFDNDGLLSRAEVFNLVDICIRIQFQFSHFSPPCKSRAGSINTRESPDVVNEIMSLHDPDFDSFIQLDDFLIWSEKTEVLNVFCDLLEQICHIVFGLKPTSPEEEGQLLRRFIKREKSLLIVGSKWFIIPQSWWLSWIEHTTCSDEVSPHFGVFNGTSPPSAKNSNTTFPKYKSASASSSPLASRKNQKIVPSLRRKEHMYTVNPLPTDLNRQSVLGAIDTTKLLTKEKLKAPQLTSEEILRSESEGKIECVPAAVWKCLITWYGSSGPAIQRVAIRDPSRQKGVKIETHPLLLNIYQHAPKSPSIHSLISQQVSATINSLPIPVTNVFSQPQNSGNLFNPQPGSTPSFKRVLSKTVVLSQASTIDKVRNLFMSKMNIRSEDIRLWHFRTEDCLILLRDESTTLYEAGIQSGDSLLVELRHNLGWPEVLLQTNSSSGTDNEEGNTSSPNGAQLESRAGQAGLHNIGNTCFMNSALQCLSHTYALTTYFLNNKHFYEINMKNVDGSKGQVALCYGHLVQQLWSSNNSVVRPSIIRDAIIKHRSQFNNSSQHDAQEMLEAILDLLHEDLNRVTHNKSYQTLGEADGREDRDVADEQWTAHLKNNNSIICDLFSGQMQSKMTCAECSRSTSKFDVFNVLSLSIPSDQMSLVYILLQKLDGNPPTRYAMRVARRTMTYGALKKDFSLICNLENTELVFVEYNKVMPSMPGAILEDNVKLKNHCSIPNSLLAFQCTSPQMSGTSLPQTPLMETPSVSNDSLTTVDSRPLANDSSSHSKYQDKVCVPESPQSNSSNHYSITPKAKTENAAKVGSESLPDDIHTDDAGPITQTMTSPVMNGHAHEDELLVVNQENGPVPKETGQSNLLIPNNINGVPLTPSSSGYASETWKSTAEPVFIFAIHSKPTPNSVYFLWENRSKATIFGCPVLVPLPSGTTNADVYNVVENQISRLITASPMEQYSNHAKDCDEKLLGSGCHPFSLRRVAYPASAYSSTNTFGSPSYNQASSNSLKCWNCPWNKVCKGCIVEPNDDPFELPPKPNSPPTTINSETLPPVSTVASTVNSATTAPAAQNTLYFLAIEWDITTLHLRYKFSAEKECQEHKSVAECERAQKQNLSLDDCLSLLVKEQIITDFSPCPKCKSTKITLSHHIWRAPPTLIIHLKRYEQPTLNGTLRWIKCHRKINFPFENLNLLPFVSRGAHQLNKEFARINSGMHPVDVSNFSEAENVAGNGSLANGCSSSELSSSEDMTVSETEKFELDEYFNYKLFSVSCHSGNLSNGHYVSVCRNPLNQKWFCFDDNTCKEVPVSSVPLDTTYLLFYELTNMNFDRFLPSVEMKQPIINPSEFQSNPVSFLSSSSDNRKNCFIQ